MAKQVKTFGNQLAQGFAPDGDIKGDLLGSTLTRGINDTFLDRATRRFLVKNLDNDRFALGNAIALVENKLNQESGFFHQSITDLPRAYVTATKVGPGTVWVNAHHRRVRTGGGGGTPAQLLARTRGAVEGAKWYSRATDDNGNQTFDSLGRPNGPLIGNDLQFFWMGPPQEWTWQVGVTIVYVNTVLSAHPLALGVGQFKNTVNQEAFNFGGIFFDVGEYRFDDVIVDAYETQSGVEYRSTYVGTYRPGGHVQQRYKRDGLYWEAVVEPQYPSAPIILPLSNP